MVIKALFDNIMDVLKQFVGFLNDPEIDGEFKGIIDDALKLFARLETFQEKIKVLWREQKSK